MVKYLLDSNAKPNKKDISGNTPLIYACSNGHHEVAALLLQVSCRSRSGAGFASPGVCVTVVRPSFRPHRLSFQHGASINVCNNKGNTALHEAVIEKHVFVVELLLLHGASVQVLNKRQCTALDCAEQVSGGPLSAPSGSHVVTPHLK